MVRLGHKHLVEVVPFALTLFLFLLFQVHTSHAGICWHKKNLLCSRWL